VGILLCVGVVPSWASQVRGSVTSSEGEPIPAAAVALPALGRGALTDSLGAFSLSDVPSGEYLLVARAVGFLPDTQRVSLPGQDASFRLRPDPLLLPPVTVTRPRVREIERTTAFVSVIRPAEAPSPTSTVPELLDETVGVQVRSMGGHGSFSTVSIRSSTSEQVRVYLDGIPLNQALGGGVNLATIPVSTIERVEVYRGVIPPNFGGSGTAGVINFTTRTPSDSLRWNYGVSYGTWDTRMAHGWLSRRFGPVAGVVAVDYSHSDNDFLYWDDNGTTLNPDDDGWARRRNNQFLSFNVLARLTSLSRAPVRWALSYSFLHTNNHLPGNSTFHELLSTARLRGDQQLMEGTLGGALPWLSEGEIRLYRSFRRDRYENLEGLVGLGRSNTDDTTSVWGGQLALSTFVLPANRLSLHAGFRREGFDPNDLLITDAQERERLFYASRRRQRSAYLSDELALFERRLVITGQVGYEHVRNNVLQDTPLFGANVVDTSVVEAWPRAVGLMLSPRPWIRFRANWGTYMRLPNLYELFGDRGSSVGNGLLRPETGTNCDIGVELQGSHPSWGIRQANAELVYFESRVTDMIVFWSVYNRMKPFNVGGADIRGVEASSSLATSLGISTTANLTWQRPINRSTLYGSLYYGNDLPHRPRWQFDLRTEYARGLVTLFYGLHAHNRFFAQPVNSLADVVPAAWLHDAGVRVRFCRWLAITLEGKNLTDVRQFDSRYVPLPGRSWFVSLQGMSL